MTQLAALGSAHAAHLAGAVRREVVLVDVALALGGVDGVEALPLVEHAQGEDGQHLGLAALEEAGAMGAGQVAGLDVEGSHLVDGAAVDALAGGEHHGAHGLLLEGLAGSGDLAAVGGALLVGEGLLDLGLQLLDLGQAGLLVSVLEGCVHLVVEGGNLLDDLGDGLVELVVLGLDVAHVEELLLLVAELADDLLGELEGAEHVLLGHLVAASLDHGDVLLGAGHGEVEVRCLLLGEGGVDDVLAGLDVAGDADAGAGAVEGGAAHHQGSRGAHDGDDVGLVDLVAGQGGDHDVDVVAEAVGKTGADGAVDHAGGEGALVRGARLALEIAAGDAAHGVHLLDEVDGQGEEVEVALLLGDNRGGEQDGVSLLHDDGAGGLLGQLAGLEDVVLAVEVELVGDLVHVVLSFLFTAAAAPRAPQLLLPTRLCARAGAL